MLELYQKPTFKKQLKKYKHNKSVMQELDKIVKMLLLEQKIPEKYRNHKLVGNYEGVMEMHLCPDDLLICIKVERTSITLVAIGSHSELF